MVTEYIAKSVLFAALSEYERGLVKSGLVVNDDNLDYEKLSEVRINIIKKVIKELDIKGEN